MRLRAGCVAVVTGAAGGIGRAISVVFARRGCDLALVDVDEAGLRETATIVEASGRRASAHVTDVSDRVAIESLPEGVLREHGAPDLLVNNAGVGLSGPLAETSLEDLEWVMGVNFWGAVLASKVFLPHLSARSEAHIVNVLSSFALAGFPAKSGYCASKFALRGFTEALRA